MIILGINSYHANSSAALIVDGKVIFAIEEERLNRIKNSGGFPYLSIQECLKYKKIKLNHIDYIAINTNPKNFFFKKVSFALGNLVNFQNITNKLSQIYKKISIGDEINKIENFGNFEGKIINVEHHETHIASSYFMSKFNEACGVSVDGSGDFTTTSNAHCTKNKIMMNKRIFYPHSLGIFYSAITTYLGFDNFGEEYKVMALAPYGNSSLDKKLSELIYFSNSGNFNLNLNFFLHHKNINTFSINNNKIIINNLLDEKKFCDLIGFPKKNRNDKFEQCHFNLAYSLQKLFEEIYLSFLNNSFERFNSFNLCLAGGCAMNSVANGKILNRTKFKNLFIQPASYDAGGAIGAALSVFYKKNPKRNFLDYELYLGPNYSNNEVSSIINQNKIYFDKTNISVMDFRGKFNELIDNIVQILIKKKIVGIFRDRLEWGARALGNRSIIADPRGSEIKEIINSKIKRRESFRPFAPIILSNYVKDWFNINRNINTMMEVHQIKKEKKDIIPAVVHKDETCRLQTLEEKDNYFMSKLISSFNEITNVPILLNTSFNENEPIVCKPQEAINTFLRTDMDALILQDFLLLRKDNN